MHDIASDDGNNITGTLLELPSNDEKASNKNLHACRYLLDFSTFWGCINRACKGGLSELNYMSVCE